MASKKGGKDAAAPAGADEGAQGVIKSLEGQLELQQIEMNALLAKVEQYKDRCTQLAADNERMGRIQQEINTDRSDIVDFLSFKVGGHEQHIRELEAGAEQAAREHADALRRLEAAGEQTQATLGGEVAQLQAQLAKCKAKLDQVADFRTRKEEMEQQIMALRELLEHKVAEYKNSVHEMERKIVQDKSKTKADMVVKINDAVYSFRTVAEQQMAETTKRAIRENLIVTSQVKTLSDKVLELVKENDKLRESVGKLRTSNTLLKDSEIAMAKKNQANQRAIQVLVAKLQASGRMLETAYEIYESQGAASSGESGEQLEGASAETRQPPQQRYPSPQDRRQQSNRLHEARTLLARYERLARDLVAYGALYEHGSGRTAGPVATSEATEHVLHFKDLVQLSRALLQASAELAGSGDAKPSSSGTGAPGKARAAAAANVAVGALLTNDRAGRHRQIVRP